MNDSWIHPCLKGKKKGLRIEFLYGVILDILATHSLINTNFTL
jgi:hypothetical protein